LKKITSDEAQDVFNVALAGANLQGFAYNRDNYSLYFDIAVINNITYQGYNFPSVMILNIESVCQWRIGTKQHWDKLIIEKHRADLAEPELSALLWDKKYGGLIEKVLCDKDSIKIILRGNREIFILNHSQYPNNVWEFCEAKTYHDVAGWLLAWNDSDGYFLRTP